MTDLTPERRAELRELACCDGPLSATPKATAEPATRQEALL